MLFFKKTLWKEGMITEEGFMNFQQQVVRLMQY
jgi:hypothetical protein